MSMIFGSVEIPEVPVELDMPLATTEDDMLEVVEEASYEGLTETEEAMIDAIVHISLADTPLASPSGPITIDVTPGTDSQFQSVTPGTDAQIDRATV
ncbi:hypothetical protein H5410_037262 [Solanum commersonii]|uniref:Polyprotein protein n=1 Tax=Solanum commersonii TaxID=4109 RepID=A0A9J5YAP5_SOLCO|nr:hypothetical protein H5410_037262 [Solanum commersonii]